ncbi:MAG TPA: tetratricopeptide repeat protein, partial [Isosphaeraceae bacterium]
ASGGTTADSPRCIVTGGAATLSISFEGKSYPLCCTGCRDEFQENPAKYVQKALSRARAGGPAPASRPTGAADDGSFDGLFAEPKAPARPPTTRPAPPVRAQTPTEPTTTAAPRDRPTTQGEPAPKPAPAAAAKAASLLRFGRALEQAGNTAGALGYYRQVVKDYPNSEPARSATARIKALDGRD